MDSAMLMDSLIFNKDQPLILGFIFLKMIFNSFAFLLISLFFSLIF